MEPHIRARFTSDTRAALARAAGVSVDDLREQAGFESVIFEAPHSGSAAGTMFVKATWSERRTPTQIEAEMRFASLLADAGVRVARPVPLGDNGRLVVSLPADGGEFHISATERAPGEPLHKADLEDAHYVEWGRLLAQMHRLAAQPAARSLIAERPAWQDEHRALVRYATDPLVRQRYESLLQELARLPDDDPAVFGLMHTDVHTANVRWQGHTPTAFDFDDCTGFWYASDVAIVLFYTFTAAPGSDGIQTEFERKLAAIRTGYESCHRLPEAAWSTVPLFLNLRDAVLYLVVERSIPPDQRGEGLTMLTEQRLDRLRRHQNAMGLRFP